MCYINFSGSFPFEIPSTTVFAGCFVCCKATRTLKNNRESLCNSAETGSEMGNAKTFLKFLKLPAEIRRMIWKVFHNAYAPRAVTLCYNPDTGFYSKTPPTVIFSVNHESRVLALGFFQPAFKNITRIGDFALVYPPNHAPVYLDFSKDVIYLQAAQGDKIRSMIQAMRISDLNMMKHLAINDLTQLETSHDSDISDLCQSLLVMPQLQRLFVVKINAWLVWDKLAEAEAQHVFFKGHGVRGGVWQRISTRKSFVEEMRVLEGIHAWKAPAVCCVNPYELMLMPANWQRCNGTLISHKGRWSIGNPRVRGQRDHLRV